MNGTDRQRKGEGAAGAKLLLLAAFACLSGATACGSGDLPPRLPSTETHDRAASRVELVDFVVSDRERARKVRALYVEIEELMLEAKTSEAKQLVALGAEPRTDAETREAFRAFRNAELTALRRYARIQLELRQLTTPDEFTRLDAIK